MHARFALEVAVRVIAFDLERCRFDAALGLEDIHHLGLELPALGPARVHAQKHRSPIAGLGAALPGVDREEGPRSVRLSRKQLQDRSPSRSGR